MGIDFGILGEMQVVQDETDRDLGSLRQRGLLARLIIHRGQPLTTDRLMDELWPDDAPDSARHALHVYVSRLREALGTERSRLTSDPAGYRLHIDPEELDASRFERLTANGRAAGAKGDLSSAATLLREGLGLWRGPALFEFADEPFASTEATRLDQLRLAALEDRISWDLELGKHAALCEELRQLTLEQPFREAFWEQYMLALYRSGRQEAALRAFGEVRTRLADDLGIEPGPSLQRLAQRMLAQDPSLSGGPADSPPPTSTAAVPRLNLPQQRTSFVGRERDLAIAGELLAVSRLLTLTGAPGSGKTRMALRLATIYASRYPRGAVFVPLAGVSDPRRLEPSVAEAVDVLTESADARPSSSTTTGADGSIAERVNGGRCLLILDNLEQIPGADVVVSRLLDEAPDLTILATSRAPLRIAGEQEFPVLPLQVPPPDAAVAPDSLVGYDAVALLVARAKAGDPGFEVTPENAAALARITERLDGLPLAIELGAGRLRFLTPQSLLERLERSLPLLATEAGDAIARHQTLRSAIAWSYELLDDTEQRLFRRLTPFVGGFTAEAAAAVDEQPLEDLWFELESLLAKSLLYRSVETGEARFAMLQTLREFGAEQLEATGELDAVLARHARYYAHLAEVPPEQAGTDDEDATISLLIPELENIRAALSRCEQSGDTETGLRLASASWRVWQAAGRLAEGREWLTRLLEGDGAPSAVRTDALVALAGLTYWQADYEAAWVAYERALELFRESGDRAAVADVLYGMSMTATWRGDPATGGRLAIEARVIFDELGATAKVGETMMAEGFALWQDRQYIEARPCWEQALAISRQLGADALAVTQLAGLAGMEFHTGSSRDATRIALDALDQACDLENVAHCVWLLDFIAAFNVDSTPATAVRIAGAADALRRASGGGMRVEDLHIEPARSAAARSMGPVELERAWSEGRAMSLEDAIEAARGLRPPSSVDGPAGQPAAASPR